MVELSKKVLKQIITFLCNQYLILFFIITTSTKIILFNKFIVKATWPIPLNHIDIICSFVSVAAIFSILFFIKKHKNKIAIILAFLLSILLLIDTVYFSYFKD